MMRITTLLLCLILAAAAAGRYKAEVAVQDAKSEVRALDRQKAEELSSIQVLRAEVAFLERPERLAQIAQAVTGLEPLTGAQLATADDLRFALAADEALTLAPATTPVTVAGLE